MLEQLLDNLFMPFYGITLLVSLYKYPKYFDTKLQYLPIIFLYTFLNELLGYLIFSNYNISLFKNSTYTKYNIAIYNIYNIIFYLYFIYIFMYYIKDSKIKKNIKHGMMVFVVVALANPLFQSFSRSSQIGTYVFGGIVLLGSIYSYLKELPKKQKNKWSKCLLFWLASGLLIFYIGYIPIKVFRHYFNIPAALENSILRPLHIALIIVCYVCFTIGFLRMKQRLPEQG